ncbi:MAG: RidA family protein [Sphingobacteriales bacterium]|nr:MAG: RidA family protein [Sphingobacteriales bacterium]
MNTREIIQTSQAAAPIGPYNQAVRAGNMLFISGQIALDPQTGLLYDGGDIAEETRLVMDALQAILNAAGSDFSQAVKTSIFILDMAAFGAVNEVYGRYFEGMQAPARETIAVAGLPKGARVEISMIALIP